MSLKHLRDLHWNRRRGNGRLRAVLVAAALLVTVGGALEWKQAIDGQQAQQERRLQQAERLAASTVPRAVQPTPRMSPAAVRQVNAQVALLNRDWAALLRHLVPDGEARLLTLDVHQTTGAVRLTGRADSAARANASAERLQRSALTANHRILFQLEFSGFSRLGSNPLKTLKENVPRYQYLREEINPPSRFTQYD